MHVYPSSPHKDTLWHENNPFIYVFICICHLKSADGWRWSKMWEKHVFNARNFSPSFHEKKGIRSDWKGFYWLNWSLLCFNEFPIKHHNLLQCGEINYIHLHYSINSIKRKWKSIFLIVIDLFITVSPNPFEYFHQNQVIKTQITMKNLWFNLLSITLKLITKARSNNFLNNFPTKRKTE